MRSNQMAAARKREWAKLVIILLLVFTITCGLDAQTITAAKYQPASELRANDPEIRHLLDTSQDSCGTVSIDEVVSRSQRAVRLADNRGLVRDRALAEAALAAGYVAQAKLDLAFAEYQRALQDALDSQNTVLQHCCPK